MGTSPLPQKGADRPPQIFGPCLLWPNGWMDQDATWHEDRPQPRRLCVIWGLSSLPTKGVEPSPQFSAHFYCGQTAGCIKMPLGMEVVLSPWDFGLAGDPAPLPKGRRRPGAFSAHDYCGRTARWIKMALGMEVSLGPFHIVLDGNTAPLPKTGGRATPNFGPSLLWPNGWMHQDATWYGGRTRPTRHCVRCVPSYPRKRAHPLPPNFWPMSIVAKWLNG